MNRVRISVVLYDYNLDYIHTRYRNIRRIYIKDIRKKQLLARIDVEEGEA